MNSYQKVLSKLYILSNESKHAIYTLESIHSLYQKISCPGKNIPMVHIAGTNGKGSVSYKMAKAFVDSGYKTALFTSPHISSFRERMQIDFQMISKEEFVEVVEPLFAWKEQSKVQISFFELLVLASLKYFEKNQVEIAIIETGLGGRLDATNIIHPMLSIIVSIGLDHCHILGDTLDAIAFEKGGIIKSKTPVVIGPNARYSPIFEIAKQQQSPCFIVEDTSSDFDTYNRYVAKKGLDILQKTFPMKDCIIDRALSFRPPCRMEEFTYLDKQIILDVAHNPSGLEILKKSLAQKYPKQSFEVCFAISKGKDINGICKIISSMATKIHLIAVSHSRLESIDRITPYLQNVQVHTCFSSVLKQLESHLLVCGSFFIMSKVRQTLQIQESIDELDLNEKVF